MTEEIIQKIEDPKKTKKSKKDVAENLDEILFGGKKEENIDMGETPEFISFKKTFKEDKNIPDYLRY